MTRNIIFQGLLEEYQYPLPQVTNSNWRQGRQLLRQYLQVYRSTIICTYSMVQQILYTKSQEIGYTDTIIDVRSNRVRSLLGLQADQVGTLDVLKMYFHLDSEI